MLFLNFAQLTNTLASTDIDSTVAGNAQLNRNRRQTFLSVIYDHLVYYPTPSSLSYLWGFGSLAGVFLVIQIITGIILVMHYKPSVIDAFNSMSHLMYDVPSGWFLRYLHANGASMFFILIYLHMGRGLYYGSFLTPRNWIWISGIIIFLLIMGAAFIGYVLPWGQISFWGATVITNLISAIPLVGESIVVWIWGNFSVSDATLNRFFSLHYLLPFILAIIIIIHLYFLHIAGSNNPLGLPTTLDITKLPFYSFFYIKDILGFLAFCLAYVYFVFFDPNILGHADNYILANPMVTPPHIVPEWYFLPFYAILRSIPFKFGGVVAMVGAIMMGIFQTTMYTYMRWLPEAYYTRSMHFLPLSAGLFWIFVANFFLLGFIGGCPVEAPYLEIGQAATKFFFLYWFIAPLLYAAEQRFFVESLPANCYNIIN